MLLITILALGAAGCGGGGGGEGATTTTFSGQLVTGDRFSFRVPEDWTAKVSARGATVTKDDALVSVVTLPLFNAYNPKLFPRVTNELDRVAKELATKLGGELTSSRSITAPGGKAREYEIEHKDLVDRITFLLRGKREYQVTCRWPKADAEPEACDLAVGSFIFG